MLRTATDLTDDARLQITRFAAELDTPPLLLGHSMGGGLAARLAVVDRLPLSGCILSSPALALGLKPGQRLLLNLLKALAPGLRLPNGLDADFLSHDADVVAAYRNDELVHDKVCARLIDALDQAGRLAREQAGSLALTTLLLVAGSDRLVDPSGSREFADRAGLDHLTVRWYESAFHEIFNEAEPMRLKVVSELGDWLDHHFPTAPARNARTVEA